MARSLPFGSARVTVDSAIARDQEDRLVAPSSVLEALRMPATGSVKDRDSRGLDHEPRLRVGPHGFTTVRCHKVDSKPWLAIRTSAIASLDGSHELVPMWPPEPKESQRDGLLCPERRSGRASTRADQSDRSGPKPALLAHTAHTTSKTTTERPDTTISKVPRRCFRALGPTGAWAGCTRYLRPHAAHTATVA